MPPYDTAAKEAFEAGVIGKVSKRPIGSNPYDKNLEEGHKARCRVQVFALRVTRQHSRKSANAELDGIRLLKPCALFASRFASHHSEIRETAMSRGSYLEDATWTV